MGYLGNKPTAVPIESSDLADNLVTSAKIANGAITGDDINATFNIGSKTVTLPASSVTAHASDYIAWQSVVTAATLTAVAGRGYPINTTANACTVTLPASASVGDTIKFVDYARNWGTNALTLNQNSLKFQGNAAPNPVYDTNGQSVTITYVDATQGWIPTVDDDAAMETPQSYSVDFLVAAGGASGGSSYNSGGGGAGGYRTSTQDVLEGLVITVTVGDGGATVLNAVGNDGSTSSISGAGTTTITSAGGGKGGTGTAGAAGSGGSGGGGGSVGGNTSGGAGNTPSTSPVQGYAGGAGVESGPGYPGGGGGGASAVGGDASTSVGGVGGAGSASSITGSSVTRSGGGGGCNQPGTTPGAGGAGGGGAANAEGSTATSGTANTGGGGGASRANGQSGAGGKGVVILSMLDAKYSGTTTGSPTVATGVSGKTVLTFTGTGSYTTT